MTTNKRKKVWVGWMEENGDVKTIFDWGEAQNEGQMGKFKQLKFREYMFNNKFYKGEKKIRIIVEEIS